MKNSLKDIVNDNISQKSYSHVLCGAQKFNMEHVVIMKPIFAIIHTCHTFGQDSMKKMLNRRGADGNKL